MKIWSVSCALAAILLLTQAQRRGSRRFDVAQVADSLPEEEDPPLTRGHRFDSRKQTEVESSDRFPSRSRSRTREDNQPADTPTDFRRRGSKQEVESAQNPNLRQVPSSRRSKEINFRPRNEPDVLSKETESDFRRTTSDIRTRGRSNEEDKSKRFRSRSETDSISQTSETETSTSRSSSRFSGRESAVRSRSQNGVTNERRPLLPITSISPEDVTFPSRSKPRQSLPPEDAFTIRDSSSNFQKAPLGNSRSRSRDTTFPSRTFPSRITVTDSSSARGSSRGRVSEIENSVITPSSIRSRNDFASVRSKPSTELPGQDVEARIPSRRRTFDSGRKKPTTAPDTTYISNRAPSLPREEVRPTSATPEEKTITQAPLYSSEPVTPPKIVEEVSSEIPENRVLESGLEPVPTVSNDVLVSTEFPETKLEVSETPLDPQTESLSPGSSKDDILNKALHARSRGRGSGAFVKDNPDPTVRGSTRTNFRTRQRNKDPEVEPSKFTSRGRTSRPETTLESEPKERLNQRGSSNSQRNKPTLNEQNVQEIRNSFRTRNSKPPPSRLTSASKDLTDQDHNTEVTTPVNSRQQGGFETTPQFSAIEPQTEASATVRGIVSGSRRTLPKMTVDSETSTKPSRGRGQVRQSGGKRNENEVRK